MMVIAVVRHVSPSPPAQACSKARTALRLATFGSGLRGSGRGIGFGIARGGSLRARGEVSGRIGEVVGVGPVGMLLAVVLVVLLVLVVVARLWEPVLLRWFSWLRVKACMVLA